MVSIKQIEEANRQRSSSSPRTAVFIGATSGIGLGCIGALLKSIKGCTIFIIGRSESKFVDQLSRLQAIDPSATITFIEAQVSVLREIERVCASISTQSQKLDLLWLSQGGLGLRESQGFTSEDLPSDFAVSYYGRILFMRQMAPLLSRSPDGRVISVLSPGFEGPIDVGDPALKLPSNYAAAAFWGAQKQGVTMQSLAMRHLSTQHPGITFLHTNPGPVSTEVHSRWSNSFTGIWTPVAWLIRLVMVPLFSLVAYSAQQAGEMGLFEAMEERFSRHAGKNFYRIDHCAVEITQKGEALLDGYEVDGTQQRIWEHTEGVFENVLAS